MESRQAVTAELESLFERCKQDAELSGASAILASVIVALITETEESFVQQIAPYMIVVATAVRAFD